MSKWNRLEIFRRDGFQCLYCGFDGRTFEGWRYLTIDHIDPTGPDETHNLATCCSYCNSCKNNDPCQSVDEARAIVKRHDTTNRAYWDSHVRPSLGSPRAASPVEGTASKSTACVCNVHNCDLSGAPVT
jgi:5-methylcytosine-specific restriction endonuclease McrA